MITYPTVNRLAHTGYQSQSGLDTFIVVIDSLGRRWNPLLHPRDENGRFIRTFSFVTFNLPDGAKGSGRVMGVDRDGNVVVKMSGVGPTSTSGVKQGDYYKVPSDKVQVQTVKAQLGGKGTAGTLQRQEARSVGNAINSLRNLGLKSEADQAQEALGLAMADVKPGDPNAQANKDRAIDLFRQVGEAVGDERGKGFKQGDDFEEVRATLKPDEIARLGQLDDVISTMLTARHSIGDKTIDDVQNDQGVIKGNRPEVRIQAAENELAKDADSGVTLWDATGPELQQAPLPKPVKAQVRGEVRENQAEGVLPELQPVTYQEAANGLNRLAGYKQAQQVAPYDRFHVDMNGDQVIVGSILHVEASTSGTAQREAFTGMVMSIHQPKGGAKQVKVRQFDPDFELGNKSRTGKELPYKDWKVTSDAIALAGPEDQNQLFNQLALAGKSAESQSLVKAWSADYIKAQQRRLTPGQKRTSPSGGFFDALPIGERVRKDVNGEEMRVGDHVQGPNGEQGVLVYISPKIKDSVTIELPDGQTQLRVASGGLTRLHGPSSDAFPGESDYFDNNYVPTRDEAADIADQKYGATSVADAIRNGGDSTTIQAAMSTDVQFQAALDDVEELVKRRTQALSAGQEPDQADKDALKDFRVMAAASAEQFREPDDAEPMTPSAPVPDPAVPRPTNPANPTEKIDPTGVSVRTDDDGSTIVDDNIEDPIDSNDTAAIDAAVADAAGAAAPEEQAAPTPAQSLASQVATDLHTYADDLKTTVDLNNVQRANLDKYLDLVDTAVEGSDADGYIDAVKNLTRIVNNRNINANMQNSKLQAILNGAKTNKTPLTQFLQDRVDAGNDIFGSKQPVSTPTRPEPTTPATPDGVHADVDKADNIVSEALSASDGSSLTIRGGETVTDGFQVMDPGTVRNFDQVPTEQDLADFLNETAGSPFDGVSIWHDEDVNQYGLARVGIFDDQQEAADSAVLADANQFVDLSSGQVHNVDTSTDPNLPAESTPDSRSGPAQEPTNVPEPPTNVPEPPPEPPPEPAPEPTPEAPVAEAPETPEEPAPPPTPTGFDVDNLPDGWAAPPGMNTVVRHQDGSMIIANPDGTYTLWKADGTTVQLDSPEEAFDAAHGGTPDTTEADDESAQVGLVNPGHPVPFDFSRTADDTTLTHQPTGDTITVDSEDEGDNAYVVRDEDGAVEDRLKSLDAAVDALSKDTQSDPDATSGVHLADLLDTHPWRDFSRDKKGNPAVDRKTGKPLTPEQARARALKDARKQQRKEWLGSGSFYAVVDAVALKAKVISGDREGYELDPSETDLFAALAQQIHDSAVPQSTKDRISELTDPAALTDMRMFVDARGGAIAAVDPDGRIIGPFTGNNSPLKGVHGNAVEELTRKAVRSGGGRYSVTRDDGDADRLAFAGLKPTHHLPDGSIVYQYDPERVGGSYDPTTLTTAPNLATALTDHANWRQQYESNPFHIALDQGEMGDVHVRVDVPDIDPKTGQQKVDKDGNPLTRSKKGPWGQYGASGLIVRAIDPQTGEDRFLMVQRSNAIGNSGKWQFGGGAINSNETGEQGAAREFFEETLPPAGWLSKLTHVGTNTTTNQQFNWNYANVAADTPTMFDPTLDYESSDAKWLTRQEIADLEVNGELLPAVEASIRDSLTMWGGTPQSVLPQGTKRPAPPPKGGPEGPAGPEAPEAPEAPAGDQLEFEFDVPQTTEHPAVTPTSTKTFVRDAGGSNGAGYYDVEMSDGSTQRYVIKKLDPDPGRQEALASALYRRLGIDAPEVSYNEDERALYSKVIEGVSSSNFTPEQSEAMRDGFATDAWLAAWDIRQGDNTLLTRDGKPVRIDNGGTLEYRARGGKKGSGGTVAFGNTVGELDTFRDGRTQASQIYGKRGATPDGWEADSAQRVVDLPDDDIRGLVGDFKLPDTLADTLIARKQDIASRYSLSPTPEEEREPTDALASAVEAADHPDGSVAGIEATTPASPAAVSAGSAAPLTHSAASEETKWGDDKDRSNLIPVAKVGDAHTLTMSDGTSKDYAVYKPKSPDQGQRMQLASALYNELGIATPAVDYDASEDQVYAALTEIGPDRGAAGHDDVKAGFALDAWLGNLRINPKTISYGPDGTPIRSDLRFVLGGAKTKLDPDGVAATLDGLRNPGVNAGAASIFGSRTGGFDDFEYDGATDIASISDERIRELVAESGMDSSMADTLIKRRDGISDYYDLVDPSTPVLAKVSYQAVNAAESLRDAKKNLSKGDMIGYVRSHMADGSSYTDVLKSNRGLSNAFDALWREYNPDKPDRISGDVSQVTLPVTFDQRDNPAGAARAAAKPDPNVNAAAMVDTLLAFDMSDETRKEAAKTWTNNNPGARTPMSISPEAVLQAISEQRGYDAINPDLEWDDYLDLLNSSATQVFRTVGAGEGLSADQVLNSYKTGAWRGSNGGKAAGTGVYVAEALQDSNGYGWTGSASWLDFAFDIENAHVTTPDAMRNAIRDIRQYLGTTNLSQEERDGINLILHDAGTLAAALGYDAVYGNDGYMPTKDKGKGAETGAANYNILNRAKVYFHKNPPVANSKTQHKNVQWIYDYNSGGQQIAPGQNVSVWWGAGQGIREPEVFKLLGLPVEPSGSSGAPAEGTPEGDVGDTGGGDVAAGPTLAISEDSTKLVPMRGTDHAGV